MLIVVIGLLVGKNLNGQQTSTSVSFFKLTKEQNITNKYIHLIYKETIFLGDISKYMHQVGVLLVFEVAALKVLHLLFPCSSLLLFLLSFYCLFFTLRISSFSNPLAVMSMVGSKRMPSSLNEKIILAFYVVVAI